VGLTGGRERLAGVELGRGLRGREGDGGGKSGKEETCGSEQDDSGLTGGHAKPFDARVMSKHQPLHLTLCQIVRIIIFDAFLFFEIRLVKPVLSVNLPLQPEVPVHQRHQRLDTVIPPFDHAIGEGEFLRSSSAESNERSNSVDQEGDELEGADGERADGRRMKTLCLLG
jgi:hypothetical protein